MMIKFSKVCDDIQESLINFCTLQDAAVNNSYVNEENIADVVDAAFSVFRKYAEAPLNAEPIYRYSLCVDGGLGKKIYPENVQDNSVIYSHCIYLGSIVSGAYFSESGRSGISHGYDVVYDCVKQEIRLLYRIMTADEGTTAIYRTDTDYYEDFDFHEFIIELSALIISRLKKNLSVGGDV